jgi:hypothetical protein
MPGLVPGIHVFYSAKQDVDGRDKPGHDDNCEVRTKIVVNARSISMVNALLSLRA